MSGNSRNLTAKFGLDASSFKKGANEVRAELTQLNSAMLQNKRHQKELEENIKSLTKQKKSNKQATDEEKRKYDELTNEVDKATLELAKLKTKEQELKSQIKETTKELGEHTDEAKKLSDAYQNVGKALKAGVQFTGTAVAGMFAYTAEIAASADEINTLAKQTGLSTAEIQKFMYAAELIDVPLETLTGSMAKLVKNMNTATSGTGEAYDAFLALGVSITDSTGTLRNNQDVFNECISALSKIENETQRDAYALSIFGKSAQDLNPLILGGTEQLKAFGDELEREGLILSQTELDKLNEFNDKIDTFKAKFQATLVEGALEGVDAFEELFEKSDEIVDLIASLISGFAKFSGFIVDHKEAVLALVVAYGAYKAVMGIGNLIASVVTITKSLTTATQGATAAQQGMNAACNANAYVLLASALASVIGYTVAFNVASRETSETFNELIGNYKTISDNYTKNIAEIQGEISAIKEKGDMYEELRLKENRTNYEEQQLLNIAKELESQYEGQITLIDEMSGSYLELGEQINLITEDMMNQAQATALSSVIQELYTNVYQIESELKTNFSDYTIESLVLQGFATKMDNGKLAPNTDDEDFLDAIRTYNSYLDEISSLNTLLEEYEGEYRELIGNFNYYSGESQVVPKIPKVTVDSMIALADATQLVSKAEEELNKNGNLSLNTLKAISDAYPSVQAAIDDYINGVCTAEDVINHLNIAYQNDVANNKDALQAKLNTDAEYYQKLKEMNGTALDVLAEKYGVDLSNYESYAEAKLAIEREFLSSKASYWEEYYSLESGKMKVNLKDITVEQLRLVNEEGYTPEQAKAATQQMQEEYTYVYSVLIPGLSKLQKEFSTDLTDYSKWYMPQLTGNTTDSGVEGGGSATDNEMSFFQLAKEAFKKLVEDRIAEIQRLTDAENNAVDERIAAIEKEIAAREKLKDTADLQERIDFIKGQLKYSQLEDFERYELQRQLASLEDEQKEQAWLEVKNAEIKTLEAQKTAKEQETAALVEQLKANQNYANTLFTDLNNGYQSVSSIVNNNTQKANVTIVTDALSQGQVEQVVKDALGLEMIF